MFRVLFLNSSEKVPERIMAVKITSLSSTLLADNIGKNRMIINRQIRRIMLFLIKFFCVIMDLIQTLYVIVCF
jgi:hypothetical protein